MRWRLSRSPNAPVSSVRSTSTLYRPYQVALDRMLAIQAQAEGVSIVWVWCGTLVISAFPPTEAGGTEQAAEEVPAEEPRREIRPGASAGG